MEVNFIVSKIESDVGKLNRTILKWKLWLTNTRRIVQVRLLRVISGRDTIFKYGFWNGKLREPNTRRKFRPLGYESALNLPTVNEPYVWASNFGSQTYYFIALIYYINTFSLYSLVYTPRKFLRTTRPYTNINVQYVKGTPHPPYTCKYIANRVVRTSRVRTLAETWKLIVSNSFGSVVV